MAELITQGLSDSVAYLQAVANVNAPYPDITPDSGQYPLFNNTLINRRLSNVWLASHLAQRVFVDGLGVTSMTAEAENVGILRIPMLYMPPRNKRTLGTQQCPSDTTDGTPGNNLPFNNNLPYGVQTNGVDIKFNQTYDDAVQIARTTMRMMGTNLDVLAATTANIPKVTSMLYDADIMASQVAAALQRANESGNTSIIAYNPTITDDGYMQTIMNSLASSLGNVRGSYREGVVSYDKRNSVFVLRWSVFNRLMNIKNGALVNSNLAQEILLNGYLDATGSKLLGSSIEGRYNGIYIKVVADEYWDTAAAELDLTLEQYAQWNKIVGYIANGAGTYAGLASTTIDIDKAPTTSLGMIVRTDWGWGVKVVRPSSVTLLVESTNNLADFTNPVPVFTGLNSPNNVEKTIQRYQRADAPYEVNSVQRIGVAPSTLITDVTLTVNGTSATVDNAEIVVRDTDGNYFTVGNNGDGTYSFTLNRATAATVTIAAEGYQATSLQVTTADTALATKSLSATLTANPARAAKTTAAKDTPVEE